MTEGKIVVCPQCGKKYKLKAGFDAASFSCNACSATVWVKKKAASSPVSGRRRRPSAAAGRRKAPVRGRAPARGRRRQEEPAQEQEEGGGRYSSRYAKKDNSATVIMAIVGVVAVGLVIFLVASGGDDKNDQTAQVPPVTKTDGDTDSGSGSGDVGTGGGVEDIDLSKTGGGAKPIADGDGEGSVDEPKKSADTTPAKKLGGGRKRKSTDKRKSLWDPPANLAHLESTSAADRKKIDDHITMMIDHEAGRDSLDAKQALMAIGKPAFPRILGAMAKIRDTITDVDSGDERLIESSLKLADECLREMDGYLTAKGKSTLRPGSEKRYIGYICRLHYKRWMQKLKGMPEMPGPFDPTQEYDGAVEEYRGK